MDESNSVAVRGRKDVLQMFNDLMDTIGFVTGKDEAVGEAKMCIRDRPISGHLKIAFLICNILIYFMFYGKLKSKRFL